MKKESILFITADQGPRSKSRWLLDQNQDGGHHMAVCP